MNFEEMLHAREGNSTRQENLPFGVLYKKQVDHKYVLVLSVKPQLLDSLGIRKALQDDYSKNQHIRIKEQLHYELHEMEDGQVELELEGGSYQSFAQLLEVNPAVVAKSGFVDDVISRLFDGLDQLHAESLFYLCLAPQNLLIRKGDEMPMMLLHASSFPLKPILEIAFESCKDYIAPEVLEGEPISARSDIYSLGCFIRFLFSQGSVPFEYKGLIDKATQQDPEKRYNSIADMKSALQKRRAFKHSFLSFVAALVVVLCCVGLYVELVPEAEDVEFIEVPQKEQTSELFDESFSPVDSVELEILSDSGDMDTVTVEEREAIDIYMKKSEEIFRKTFAKEADRILSKIYSDENMSASEKKFMSSNNAMRDELMKVQQSLAEQSGISDDVAGRISMEVIDAITIEKQKHLKYNSSQINK